jgi:hypothetical protein
MNKPNSSFKLSSAAKRIIATAGNNSRTIAKIWINGEFNAHRKQPRTVKSDHSTTD